MNYKRMKDIRESHDLTQLEVAEILKVSRSTYAGWENSIDPIPLNRLNDFCNYFKISFDYICNLTNINKETTNKDISKESIGKRLKEVRTENNDTQKYISYIIKTDQSNYSNYETGKTMISTELIIEFAKHYNISIDYLLNKTNEKIK